MIRAVEIAAPQRSIPHPDGLLQPTSGQSVEPQAHAVLRGLAVLMVVATFFDKFTVPGVPVVNNAASVVGVLLLGAYPFLRSGRFPLHYTNVLFGLFIICATIAESDKIMAPTRFDQEEFAAFAQYLQVFVLYVILFDIARDPRVVPSCAVAFIATSTLMSLLAHSGFALADETGRAGVGVLNLNYQAFAYTLCIIGVFGWVLLRWPQIKIVEVVLILASMSCFAALARTGSRGSTIALVFGVAVALLLVIRKRNIPAYLSIVPLAIGAGAFLLLNSELLAERFLRVVDTGETSLRFELFVASQEMFALEPWTGWGANYYGVLAEWIGRDRPVATHNMYTQALVSFGLLGFIPFCLGLIATVFAGWRARRDDWSTVLLVLLFVAYFSGLSQSFTYGKPLWILLAFAGGRATVINAMRRRRASGL
jgi:O-antigen ligase